MSRARWRGIVCPLCSGDTGVIDSTPKQGTVRRRRRCLKCDHRWNTIEVAEPPKAEKETK